MADRLVNIMAKSELATRLAAEITGTLWGYLQPLRAAREYTGRLLHPPFPFCRPQIPA